MKKRLGYIFVDDGSPEASEYDSNYISYDPEVPGSYARAKEEAAFIRKSLKTSVSQNEDPAGLTQHVPVG